MSYNWDLINTQISRSPYVLNCTITELNLLSIGIIIETPDQSIFRSVPCKFNAQSHHYFSWPKSFKVTMAPWQQARLPSRRSRVRSRPRPRFISLERCQAFQRNKLRLATFNNHLKFSPLKELLREKECQVKSDLYG